MLCFLLLLVPIQSIIIKWKTRNIAAGTSTRSTRQGVVHRPAKINLVNCARMQLLGNVDIYLSHERTSHAPTGTCDLEAIVGSQCVCAILTVHTEQTKIPTTLA